MPARARLRPRIAAYRPRRPLQRPGGRGPIESTPEMAQATPSTYAAVCRGRSAAIFREGEVWTIRGFPTGPSSVDVTFRTACVSCGSEAKAPRWLYAEVSGPAESLEDAIRRFPNAVRSLTPIFDVALNTSVDDLDLHLSFDATPGREERNFFQNFLREERPTPRPVRPAHVALLSANGQRAPKLLGARQVAIEGHEPRSVHKVRRPKAAS